MPGDYKVRVLNTGSDLPAVAALLESEVPAYGGMRKTAAEFLLRLRWLLLENPDRGDFPAGWVLESKDGQLSGVHLSVPRMFSGAGCPLPVFFSCYYFVKQEARGMESLGLFLSYRKLAAQGILMASSANGNSAPLWQKLGGKALTGTECEWLLPLHLLPLAEETLFRRFGWKLKLAGASPEITLSAPPASGPVRWLSTENEITAAAVRPQTDGPLLPVRSPEWLRWKFGPGAAGGIRLYRWDGGRAPVFVAVAPSLRGRRGQIRCLQIVDAWSTAAADGKEILKDMAALHKKDADALTIRGLGDLTAAAASLRWRRRPLEAPSFWWTPPHAARLENLADFYPDSGA